MSPSRHPVVFIACIAAAALCLRPAYASAAQTARAPIAFSECRGGISSIELVEIASYDVTFLNTSALTADDIRVSIPYGRRKTATFDLRGTFEPQTVVSRKLRKTLSGGLYAWQSDQNDCTVESVHFTNGSTWNRNSPGP